MSRISAVAIGPSPYGPAAGPHVVTAGLSHDAWLSAAMQRDCFRLNLDPDPPAETDVGAALDRLPSRPVFVDAKIPVERPDLCAIVEARGFHLVDTNLTLRRQARRPNRPTPESRIRIARREDRPAVEAVARAAFVCSRFHLDPALPAALADEVKARWAGNYFDGGRGNQMIVAERNGTIAGFLQLIRGADGDLVIDLIAVSPADRGRGLAGAMITFAEAELDAVTSLTVGTQLANLPSLRLYQGDGFRVVDARYVFHFHG